jgi:hypothetical protein
MMDLGFQHIADAIALELLSEMEAAQKLWPRLLGYWERFSKWLQTVIRKSSLLGRIVSMERSAEYMERGTNATPSMGDCGRLAFRSQAATSSPLLSPYFL